jgi:hypothetical protein
MKVYYIKIIQNDSNVLRSLQKLKMNDLRLVLLGNYYNTFSNKLSFYAASPSYLNIYIVFPSHQVGSLLHDIQYCFPIITYIIILYRQKKNQSKIQK